MKSRSLFFVFAFVFVSTLSAVTPKEFLGDYRMFCSVKWNVYSLAWKVKRPNERIWAILLRIDNQLLRPLERKLRVWLNEETQQGRVLQAFLKSGPQDKKIQSLLDDVDACFDLVQNELDELEQCRQVWTEKLQKIRRDA